MSGQQRGLPRVDAALHAARVPIAYRRELLAELLDHAMAHADVLRAEGATDDEAWHAAVTALGAPEDLAAAARVRGRRWPYRRPIAALIVAPALVALVMVPVVSALLLNPLLPQGAGDPQRWIGPMSSIAAGVVGAAIAIALRDVRRRYTGVANHAWLGSVVVVVACASFTVSLLTHGGTTVVMARYAWPLAWWQAVPGLIAATWPTAGRWLRG